MLSFKISFSSETCILLDLQMVVFTMKLPETDLVFVIDRAALRNTLDFELDRMSLQASASMSEPGLALNGLRRSSWIGMATES